MLPRPQTLLRGLRASRSSSTPRSAVVNRRQLHSTPATLATEVPKDPLADPDIQRLYEQIRNHQPAVDAMMNIGKIMQSKGFDTSKPPSMMQMMKISMDKDLREAGTKLMDELKKAGIEITPDIKLMAQTMKALMTKVKGSS